MVPEYIVMTAKVAGPGKKRRIAIIQTNGEKPCRIDQRLKSVKSIWMNQVHGPDTYDSALARADQVCEHLNRFGDHKPKRFVCSKCLGEGELPQFNDIDHGECYRCDGQGYIHNDKQWKLIYRLYRGAPADERRRMKFAYEASDARWMSLNDTQVKSSMDWFETKMVGVMLPPAILVKRYDAILETEKPF